ncbi:MAG: DUF433 domain-containing protein [Nitrospirota bacterium]
MFSRITFDPEIMGGQACIRGMRISVSLIVNLIANGMTREDILAEYPDLEPEDITEALQYAAWLAKEEVREVHQG